MKMKLLIIFSTIIIFLISCKKDDNGNSNMPQIFPNRKGYKWTYRYNAGNDSVKVIQVEIVGQGKLSNGDSAKIWKYTYPNYVDSFWVVSKNNIVIFYYKPCWSCTNTMPDEIRRFVFPLHKGDIWFTNALFGDTTKVLNQVDLTTPAGNFDTCFVINKKQGYVTNSWTNDTFWMKENVGIIKLSQAEFNLGPELGHGAWILESYKLNQDKVR